MKNKLTSNIWNFYKCLADNKKSDNRYHVYCCQDINNRFSLVLHAIIPTQKNQATTSKAMIITETIETRPISFRPLIVVQAVAKNPIAGTAPAKYLEVNAGRIVGIDVEVRIVP
jgi:hypothetical protein